ncbi:hypothetical protein LTR84_005592 [Exophiala bonariae]|uniref:ATPase AAA-type core domain-containing protein n=1 Tax=Exophiala bonariae TaxID=1690606 RepID=A0AAV9N5M8_9EURO|nr:hypothetical protein LTR84_005592 [Exophiala bonariae]
MSASVVPTFSSNANSANGIESEAHPTPAESLSSRRFSLSHTNGSNSGTETMLNGATIIPLDTSSGLSHDAADNHNRAEAPQNRKDSVTQLLDSWATKLGGSSQGDPQMLLKNLTGILDEITQRFEKLEGAKPSDPASPRPSTPESEPESTYDPFTHEKAKETQEIETIVKFFCDSVPSEFKEWKSPSKHLIGVLYKRADDWVEESRDPNSPAPFGPLPGKVVIVEVRIESKPVAEFLSKTTKTSLTKDGHILFSQPFRLLIRQSHNITERLAELEREVSNSSQAGGDLEDAETLSKSQSVDSVLLPNNEPPAAGSMDVTPSLKGEDDDTPPEDLNKALAHFSQLHQFISSYFAEQLAMIESLKGATQTHISFEHLWMLFDSGTDVYCRSRKGGHKLRGLSDDLPSVFTERLWAPQAFRVVSTVGGGRSQSVPHMRLATRFGKGTVSTRPRDCFSDLSLQCYYIEYTGTEWQPVLDHIVLKPYDGTMEITDLEVYPIHYRPQMKDPYLDLHDRGKRYVNLTRLSHLRYEGSTAGDNSEEISSPVIIDMKTSSTEQDHERLPSRNRLSRADLADEMGRTPGYEVSGHSCSLGCCPGGKCEYLTQQGVLLNEYLDHLSKVLEELDNNTKSIRANPDSYLDVLSQNDLHHLLPGVVVGYSLRNRRWVALRLDLLQEIHYNALDGGWTTLSCLAIIKGWCEQWSKNLRTKTRVPIEDKGKGSKLILCVVKAKVASYCSMAYLELEKQAQLCVAAYTRRPLLPITCGDIGYTPADVERFLDNIFTLAHKWGCVLLLDEADVFLAKRLKHDVKHNGLVSVFLRVLEYYSGILFLTTNRVGTIDDAFRSRIHLTLFYPQLNRPQTIQVWESNIRRVEEYNKYRKEHHLPIMKYDKEELLDFAGRRFDAELRWNGRQIRNAFQTAIALAEYQAKEKADKKGGQHIAPRLDLTQFRTIAKATKAFDEYLSTLYGHDEDVMAEREKHRVNPKRMAKKSHTAVVSEEPTSSESAASSEESEEPSESEAEPKSKGKGKKRPVAKKESPAKKKQSTADTKKDKSGAKGKKRRHESGKKAKSKQQEDDEENSEGSDQQASSDGDHT